MRPFCDNSTAATRAPRTARAEGALGTPAPMPPVPVQRCQWCRVGRPAAQQPSSPAVPSGALAFILCPRSALFLATSTYYSVPTVAPFLGRLGWPQRRGAERTHWLVFSPVMWSRSRPTPGSCTCTLLTLTHTCTKPSGAFSPLFNPRARPAAAFVSSLST